MIIIYNRFLRTYSVDFPTFKYVIKDIKISSDTQSDLQLQQQIHNTIFLFSEVVYSLITRYFTLFYYHPLKSSFSY